MDFKKTKEKYLESINLNDKSKKGSVDEKIIPLIKLINYSENYVTTSSCSGRLVLLVKREGCKKYESEWNYVSHEISDYKKIWEELKKKNKCIGNIWFKMEAPILHVLCDNFESAMKLVEKAKISGFKYSGLFSAKRERYMVEIMACEKMEALVYSNGDLLVDENYIKESVKNANFKLKKAHSYLEKLESNIKKLITI